MNSTIERVKSQEKSGSKFGIGRTQALLEMCGFPEKKLKIIHVAGTNGKGSVCEYLTRILLCAGKRVGTFTSPEVFSYNEKFRLDGEPASDTIIARYIDRINSLSAYLSDRPSAFETETAAAILMFAEEGCEYAVIECGLGGLNDATNAVCRKEIAVITSVSLEHTAVLGDTVEEICAQKAGIIKDCPLVAPCTLAEGAKRYLEKFNPTYAGQNLKIIGSDENGQRFSYRGWLYQINMLGEAQAYNAAVAIECANLIKLPKDAIERGLAQARLDGRVQIVKTNSAKYILDGSHNPESFTPLIQTLKLFSGKKSLIFGCLSDKDVSSAAARLTSCFEQAVLVSPESYRAMEMQKMVCAFEPHIKDVTQADSVSAAMRAAKYPVVVVCGTFTILKEAEKWIEREL
ncbi:MAG: bifunctional folylpolyglutamate synthase/dihydrofolate synthase [Candidatus Coproplasma sp.]